MTIRAAFDGKCPVCENPIYKGDDIDRLGPEDGSAWAHAECVEEMMVE
jgi:hypothetical protein